MKLNLKIWRQKNGQSKGKMMPYIIEDVSHHMSFLEMLDVLNEDLIKKGEDPVEFDNDWKEPTPRKEPRRFENVKWIQRSYKKEGTNSQTNGLQIVKS